MTATRPDLLHLKRRHALMLEPVEHDVARDLEKKRLRRIDRMPRARAPNPQVDSARHHHVAHRGKRPAEIPRSWPSCTCTCSETTARIGAACSRALASHATTVGDGEELEGATLAESPARAAAIGAALLRRGAIAPGNIFSPAATQGIRKRRSVMEVNHGGTETTVEITASGTASPRVSAAVGNSLRWSSSVASVSCGSTARQALFTSRGGAIARVESLPCRSGLLLLGKPPSPGWWNGDTPT